LQPFTLITSQTLCRSQSAILPVADSARIKMLRKCSADVVVVGAGVAGCSAFYHLARLNARNPGFKPLLVDALPPLSLTSANGSFSYRNWFPSEAESPMRELVVHSIDEMDDICQRTNNALGLNRNGYLFVTRDADKMEELKELAKKLERHGGGGLRVHEPRDKLSGYRFSTEEMQYDLDGSDLLVGIDNVAAAFPNLKDSKALGALHVRRCGSLNPVKVAGYELNKAVEYCPQAEVLRGKVTDFEATGGNVSGVKVAMHNGETLEVATPNVVFATGPLFERTLAMLKQRDMSSYNVPIINELHCRAIVDDVDHVLPPTMPLTFDSDPMGNLEVRCMNWGWQAWATTHQCCCLRRCQRMSARRSWRTRRQRACSRNTQEESTSARTKGTS
jgi:glycine/D-amino acid oxidase-like deaminating enzyme